MNEEQKQTQNSAFIESLAAKIGSFRPFDEEFEPLDDETKNTMFKAQREPGWPVFKKALFVMDKKGCVMMFYRHPRDTTSMKKASASTALDTYGLTSHNSIVVHDQGFITFRELANQKIGGWPPNIQIIPAGMGHAVVASGYMYFFEVGYAIIPENLPLNIGGINVGFVELQSALDIMNSHGLEYKEMEITIAKALCAKR